MFPFGSLPAVGRRRSTLCGAILAAATAGALAVAVGAGPALAGGAWAGCGDPTGEEQQFMELLNAARANPTAAQRQLGVDLTAGGRFQLSPRPPLVGNARLIEAARGHSRDMNDLAFFGHRNPRGQMAGERIRTAGYNWLGYSENLAASFSNPHEALRELLIDEGVPDLGHRVSLLGLSEQTAHLDEIGIGIHAGNGPYRKYYSLELATDSEPDPFVTGVVYRDQNGNSVYDPGEGIPGVHVQVGTDGEAITNKAGGYGARAPEAGSYVVTAGGTTLGSTLQAAVQVGRQNVKLDFVVRPAPRMAQASPGRGGVAGANAGANMRVAATRSPARPVSR